MSELDLSKPQPSRDARKWAMFCHFSAFLGMWFPFGSLIGPLILWQLKRESDPFIDDQGKEALNFQITVAIASAVCYVLMFILVGFALLGLVLIAAVVLVVIAGVKANDGVVYRYPFTWRPLK